MRVFVFVLFLLSFDLLASNYASWNTFIAKGSKVEYYQTKSESYKLALDVIMNENFLAIRTGPSKKCKNTYGVQEGVFTINNKDIKINVSCNSYGWLTHEISTENGRKYIYDLLLNSTKVEFSFNAPDYKSDVETQIFVEHSSIADSRQYHGGKRDLSLNNLLQKPTKPAIYNIKRNSQWKLKNRGKVFSSIDQMDSKNTSFLFDITLDKLDVNIKFGSDQSRSCQAFKHDENAKIYINGIPLDIKTKCNASLSTSIGDIDFYHSKGYITAQELSEKQLEIIKGIVLSSKEIDIKLEVNGNARRGIRQKLIFPESLEDVLNKQLAKTIKNKEALENKTKNAL